MTAEEEGRRADRAEAAAAESEGRYRRGWYWWVIALVYVVGAPSLTLYVSGENQRRSEQAWCEIIVTLDDGYRVSPPPASQPVAVKLAVAVREIRVEYGC